LQPFSHHGRECFLNQTSQPGVVGFVKIKHIACQWLGEARNPRLFAELLGTHGVVAVLCETTVFQSRKHVFVAGD
jgi:hypothetical protein